MKCGFVIGGDGAIEVHVMARAKNVAGLKDVTGQVLHEMQRPLRRLGFHGSAFEPKSELDAPAAGFLVGEFLFVKLAHAVADVMPVREAGADFVQIDGDPIEGVGAAHGETLDGSPVPGLLSGIKLAQAAVMASQPGDLGSSGLG